MSKKKKKQKDPGTIFDDRDMKLVKVDAGGDLKHPKAYLIFECVLSDQEILDLGLDRLAASGVETEGKVPVAPSALGYGDGFVITVTLSASDPDQEQMFKPGVVLDGIEAEKIASASVSKGDVLRHSILVPLESWDAFGAIRDYAGQVLQVNIYKGVIEGEGQEKIGA